MMTKKIRGVLVPLVTPFRQEDLDIDAFKTNIERLNHTGLSGYVVIGSTGESVYLNAIEKEKILAAAREAVAPDKILMIGTGQESTKAAIELTSLAAKHGADCVLAVTPAFFKGQMTSDALYGHYSRIADQSPIPLLLYNVPQFTGLNMGAAVVSRLAQHPNIHGVKDSSGDIAQLTEIVRLTPQDFVVLVGSNLVFYPALCVGASGGILATANVVPEIPVRIFDCFIQGNHQEALKLQRVLNPLAVMVTAVYGVGGLKLAMNAMGFQGGEVRSPLTIPENAREELGAELEKLRPFLMEQSV
ncbi:MAG: dihydrodipicolinate synthase family protein [Deltaproteobacteria bacterium]|nr:dihydrodipicolinate synthase family protein [Deltaproteobacteria bacterium]